MSTFHETEGTQSQGRSSPKKGNTDILGEGKVLGVRLTNHSPAVQSPQSGSRCPTW